MPRKAAAPKPISDLMHTVLVHILTATLKGERLEVELSRKSSWTRGGDESDVVGLNFTWSSRPSNADAGLHFVLLAAWRRGWVTFIALPDKGYHRDRGYILLTPAGEAAIPTYYTDPESHSSADDELLYAATQQATQRATTVVAAEAALQRAQDTLSRARAKVREVVDRNSASAEEMVGAAQAVVPAREMRDRLAAQLKLARESAPVPTIADARAAYTLRHATVAGMGQPRTWEEQVAVVEVAREKGRAARQEAARVSAEMREKELARRERAERAATKARERILRGEEE